MKRVLLAIAVSSFCLATDAAPQSAPGSHLDSLSRALVAAINSGDPTARGAFIDRTLSAEVSASDRSDISALLNDLHDESGGLEILKIEPIGRGRFITVKAGSYPRLSLINLAPARSQPDKLDVIEVLKSWNPKTDSVAWPSRPLAGNREIVTTIERNLQTLANAGAFSGVVLVGKNDAILFERGYGWANLEDSIRNTPETRITIASIGKMFTATAIGQLIAAGKLSFDDTLANVLPEYPNKSRAKSVTIRQLLGHTAGLGDLFSDSAYDPHRDYPSALARASAVANRPLLFAPGTRWAYSNEGYVVLGAVIEKTSGETYDEYLRRHIFEPAGMSHTGNYAADDIVPHRAVGYRHRANDPLGVRPPYGNRTFVRTGTPAGGEYATARDLWLFSRALLSGKLIPTAIRDDLWTGRSPLPWDQSQKYGYGVIVSPAGGRSVLGHGGGGTGTGIDNEFRFFSDGTYTVVVLANIDPPAASDLAAALIKFLSVQPSR